MRLPLVHFLFELLAYAVGFALFRSAFRREARPFARRRESFWIAVGAILGAALGSKLVFLFEFPEFVRASFPSPEAFLGGKSIVGGLPGGVLGVELAKARVGLKESTLGVAQHRISADRSKWNFRFEIAVFEPT